MGQQIQIALDEHDQRRIASWLSANFQLLCVPYPFEGPEFSPEELLVAKGQRLLVFPAEAVELLSSHVVFTGTAREFVIDPTAKRGTAFEWERTLQSEPGVFVPAVALAAEFIFKRTIPHRSTAKLAESSEGRFRTSKVHRCSSRLASIRALSVRVLPKRSETDRPGCYIQMELK